MLQALSENNHDEALINATRGQKIATLELIKETRKSITGTDYPFGHAKKKVSIGEYAFEDFPDPENPVDGQVEGCVGTTGAACLHSLTARFEHRYPDRRRPRETLV